MKKLRSVLAAALITIPLASFGASQVVDSAAGTELRPTRNLENCCWVYLVGRYWCVPC